MILLYNTIYKKKRSFFKMKFMKEFVIILVITFLGECAKAIIRLPIPASIYGLIFMLPALFFFDFRLGAERFRDPLVLFNILFLGFGASAVCFVTWNLSLKLLGVLKTSVYIYAVPVITVAFSALILKEKITPIAMFGTFLTLAGLFISENRLTLKKEKNK